MGFRTCVQVHELHIFFQQWNCPVTTRKEHIHDNAQLGGQFLYIVTHWQYMYYTKWVLWIQRTWFEQWRVQCVYNKEWICLAEASFPSVEAIHTSLLILYHFNKIYVTMYYRGVSIGRCLSFWSHHTYQGDDNHWQGWPYRSPIIWGPWQETRSWWWGLQSCMHTQTSNFSWNKLLCPRAEVWSTDQKKNM